MSKIVKTSLVVGALLPLQVFCAQELNSVLIEDKAEKEKDYKIEKFYKSYSSDLYTKKQISQESANTIEDVIKKSSNVTVKTRGAFGRSLSIRGLSGERIASVVDGAKMSNQGMTIGGGGELGLIELSSVEEIEVIKGSPSIIYDPGASGGVVRVNTIKNINNIDDKIKFKYNYLNDPGFKMHKHSGFLESKYKDFYFSVNFADTTSDGLKLKNTKKLEQFISDTNRQKDLKGKNQIQDLGFESDALDLAFMYKINDNTTFFYKDFDFKAKDTTQIYGSTETPIVFNYKEFTREGFNTGLKIKDSFGFDKIDINHNQTKQFRSQAEKDSVFTEVKLKTDSTRIDTEFSTDDLLIKTGLEHTKDKARTYTHSRMTYNAIYLNGEYVYDDFTINAGLRYNHHKTIKDLMPGENKETCKDKEGISGCPGERKDSKVNYALGLIYSLNEENNLSANFSRTYRYPSLYERFARGGGFIGGDFELEPEEADNFEVSWKYLSDDLNSSFTIFRSKFDTYNSFRAHNVIKPEYKIDADEYEKCLKDKDCNPFSESYYNYKSFNDVIRRGFEFDIEKTFDELNLTTSFTIGKTTFSNGTFTQEGYEGKLSTSFTEEPLEYSFAIKKNFDDIEYSPWAKINIRHVTNDPTVEQAGGFSSFTVSDLTFGAKGENITFNGGIRNLNDRVYHEPYMPIDGIERTFFFNLSLEYEKLL